VAGPQPPDRARRRWPWAVAVAILIAGASLLALRAGGSETKASGKTSSSSGKGSSSAKAVPIVASPARRGDMRVELTALGTATALNTVTVRSRVDGQLLRVLFTEGQYVKQGDLLAEIDPRPFEVQLAQAEGQSAKDKATLENAKVDLERYQALYKGGLVPQQQVATQATTLGQIDGAIKTDAAQIENARLNLLYAKITAPISGRIGLRLLDAGNMVHANDQNGLLVITQVDPIAVLFTIPEDSLPAVLRRMKSAQLPVEAYDRGLTTKLASGTLLTIDNQIDQTTGTVKLKAVFPNKDNGLFPNQFVNVRLLVDTMRDTLIVPSASIQHSPEGTFVYVVQPDKNSQDKPDKSQDKIVKTQNVSVKLTAGEDTAIADGIAPGDLVVTDGIDKLQQGAKVTLQNAAGGKKEKPAKSEAAKRSETQ
jgi:membrane fusion protein, multidrug efflux system